MRLLLPLLLLLPACGSVVEPACERGDCLAEWSHECHRITAGSATYDTQEVPGWEHEWACAWHEDRWRNVRLTWGIGDDGCFTVPEVEVGACAW